MTILIYATTAENQCIFKLLKQNRKGKEITDLIVRCLQSVKEMPLSVGTLSLLSLPTWQKQYGTICNIPKLILQGIKIKPELIDQIETNIYQMFDTNDTPES